LDESNGEILGKRDSFLSNELVVKTLSNFGKWSFPRDRQEDDGVVVSSFESKLSG
jgi:hypothetical protein